MPSRNWLGTTVERVEATRSIETYVATQTEDSRAVVTNSAGQLSSSVVSLAELALLSGISSNVQQQITGTREDVYGSPVNTSITLGDASYTTVKSAIGAVHSLVTAIDDTVDSALDSSSTRPVENGVIVTALGNKQDSLTFDSAPSNASTNSLTSGVIYTALAAKANASSLSSYQTTLTFDSSPASASTNPVTSGGVHSALALKQDALTIDSSPTDSSTGHVQSGAVHAALATKHPTIDASNRLDANLLHDGSVSNTEFGHLDGVTSNIQTQVDAKHPTIDSSNRLSASLLHDGSVSDSEFGHLDGVTSNIQTQVDAKHPTIDSSNRLSASLLLVASCRWSSRSPRFRFRCSKCRPTSPTVRR